MQGTRLGRQELEAEIMLDVENALWTHEMVEQARKPHPVPDMSAWWWRSTKRNSRRKR